MSLALGKTVREIEDEMSISEFEEWKMYLSENPSPSDVSEVQMAQLMMMVSSYMGGKSKAQDFLVSLKFKVKRAADKVTDMAEATVEQINKMAGL